MRVPGTGGGGIVFCAVEAEATARVAQSKANLVFMVCFFVESPASFRYALLGKAVTMPGGDLDPSIDNRIRCHSASSLTSRAFSMTFAPFLLTIVPPTVTIFAA